MQHAESPTFVMTYGIFTCGTWDLVPDQGSNPGLLHEERQVLATESAGKPPALGDISESPRRRAAPSAPLMTQVALSVLRDWSWLLPESNTEHSAFNQKIPFLF